VLKKLKLFAYIAMLILFVASTALILSGEVHTNGGSIEAIAFLFFLAIAFVTGSLLLRKLIGVCWHRKNKA
jgi:hypothetical protein